MGNEFYIGLDLGQVRDYTALSVIEKIERKNPEYHVRALERFKLGTSYPAQVSRISEVMHRLPDATLVIDRTGIGRAVFDMFKAYGFRPVGITIHGGDKAVYEDGSWRVPKRDLVGVLTVAFQTGALKIAAALPDAGTLITELQNFKVRIDPKTAHDSYDSWREGVHDDLVLAVALAVWGARNLSTGYKIPIEDAVIRSDMPTFFEDCITLDDIFEIF